MPKNWLFVHEFSRREFFRLLIHLLIHFLTTFKLFSLSVPPPKYFIGQRVFISWFDSDNSLDVIEPGTVMGLAYGREFVSLGDCWYYVVLCDSCPHEFLWHCLQPESEVFPL